MTATQINTANTTTATAHRPDQLLGICQAVGEAIGIKPIFLRVGLLVLLMLSPIAMIATYAALGGFVVGSWMLFPDTQAEPAPAPAAVATTTHETVKVPELLAA